MASSKRIEVIVKPTLAELRKRLAKKRAAVMDLRTPYARASILLDQWVQKNFKTEGGKVGGWTPFSTVTLKIMERTDPGRAPEKLLQKTGALRLSFLPFADKKRAGIGSDLPYAKTHHKGEGHTPERRLLPDHNPERQTVMREAREVMADYNAKALKT